MKKIFLLGFLFAGVSMLTGCSDDLLDQQPTDSLSKENYWKTESDAVSALKETLRAVQANLVVHFLGKVYPT